MGMERWKRGAIGIMVVFAAVEVLLIALLVVEVVTHG